MVGAARPTPALGRSRLPVGSRGGRLTPARDGIMALLRLHIVALPHTGAHFRQNPLDYEGAASGPSVQVW